MDDMIEVNGDISIRLAKGSDVDGSDDLLIEDGQNYLYLSVDDWQAFKDAGDKLIADSKDG